MFPQRVYESRRVFDPPLASQCSDGDGNMSDTHDSIEVPKDWASDLLSGGHCPTTGKDCWTLLEQAVNDMQFAVALANEHLENSSLASLVAEKMLDLKDADPDLSLIHI